MRDWLIIGAIVVLIVLGTAAGIIKHNECVAKGGVYLYREAACLTPELFQKR